MSLDSQNSHKEFDKMPKAWQREFVNKMVEEASNKKNQEKILEDKIHTTIGTFVVLTFAIFLIMLIWYR